MVLEEAWPVEEGYLPCGSDNTPSGYARCGPGRLRLPRRGGKPLPSWFASPLRLEEVAARQKAVHNRDAQYSTDTKWMGLRLRSRRQDQRRANAASRVAALTDVHRSRQHGPGPPQRCSKTVHGCFAGWMRCTHAPSPIPWQPTATGEPPGSHRGATWEPPGNHISASPITARPGPSRSVGPRSP